MKSFLTPILLLSLAAAPALATEPAEAEALFAQYQGGERAFDPAVADLYCDNALIRNVRTYPDGRQRAMELPAPKYKELLRSAMPAAAAQDDYSTYADVVYTVEGEGVRISASRYSVRKQYTSPISLLVGRCPAGGVGILEELSQSQP